MLLFYRYADSLLSSALGLHFSALVVILALYLPPFIGERRQRARGGETAAAPRAAPLEGIGSEANRD